MNVICKYTNLQVILLFLCMPVECVALAKKYTIRLPLVTSLTGKRVPAGRFCTEPVNLLLTEVNTRQDILPDYNIVVDYIDDQCNSALATVKAIEVFEQTRKQQRPISATKNEFHTPLVTGPMCSESCVHVGKFLQYYDLYSVAVACVDSKVHNLKLYPNLFLYLPSSLEYAHTRVALIEKFGWTNVGIITDTSGFMFTDFQYFMKKLHEANIKVVAEEFYFDDIDRSVNRLMNAKVRIFFALCYVPSCPALACSIIRKGFYGDNLVWVFPSYFKSKRIKDCSDEDVFRFHEGLVYVGTDFDAINRPYTSEIGISGKDVNNHIEARLSENELQRPFGGNSIYFCYQAIHTAVYMLDSVEKVLQLENQTIKNYIGAGKAKWNKLNRAIGEAGINLNISGILGPTQFSPGTRIGYAPWTLIQQTRNGVRLTVASNDHSQKKLIMLQNFTWTTQNGQAPKNLPSTVLEWLIVPAGAIVFAKAVTSLFVIAFLVQIALLIKHRRHKKVARGFFSLTIAVSIGVIFTLTSVLFYPERQMASGSIYYSASLFCKTAPAMVIVGNSLTMGGLVFKIFARFLVKRKNFKTELKILSALIIWVLINLGLYLAMFFTDDYPPVARVFSKTVDDHLEVWQLDEIRVLKWRHCEIVDKYKLGVVIVVIQAFFGLVGFTIAISSKYRKKRLAIADFRACAAVIQLIYPIGILLLFIMFVSGSHLAEFAVTATFGPSNGAVLLAVYGTFFFTNKISAEINRTGSKRKRRARRLQEH